MNQLEHRAAKLRTAVKRTCSTVNTGACSAEPSRSAIWGYLSSPGGRLWREFFRGGDVHTAMVASSVRPRLYKGFAELPSAERVADTIGLDGMRGFSGDAGEVPWRQNHI